MEILGREVEKWGNAFRLACKTAGLDLARTMCWCFALNCLLVNIGPPQSESAMYCDIGLEKNRWTSRHNMEATPDPDTKDPLATFCQALLTLFNAPNHT